MVSVVPREVTRPKTLWACGPLGFGPCKSLGTTFTTLPPRLFQRMHQYFSLKYSALQYLEMFESEVLYSAVLSSEVL